MPVNHTNPDGQDIYESVHDALEAERRHLASRLQESVISQTQLILAQIKAYQQTATGQSHMAYSVLSTLVQQLLQQSFDLQNNLNPTVLESLGLSAALDAFANQHQRTSGVHITLSLTRLRDRLPTPIELALFRVTQDTVERAIYEAQATQILIQLEYEAETLHYTISDNGISRQGELLRSTQARIQSLGGAIQYEASRYGGVEMQITFCFEKPIDLTDREHDVIHLLAQGLTNKEIALSLDIRPRTVKFHLDNIYSKLGVNTRTEAAIYALRHGWTSQAPD